MRIIYLLVLSLISTVGFTEVEKAATMPEVKKGDSQPSQLSVRASLIKQSVLELNRDLYQLEEDLLTPATTRTAVYLSLSKGDFFELYSINVTVDDKQPILYLYTKRQVAALRQGAIQPLTNLNLGPGQHTIKAIAKGIDSNGESRELILEQGLEKYSQPLYIELKIQNNEEIKNAELIISQW